MYYYYYYIIIKPYYNKHLGRFIFKHRLLISSPPGIISSWYRHNLVSSQLGIMACKECQNIEINICGHYYQGLYIVYSKQYTHNIYLYKHNRAIHYLG